MDIPGYKIVREIGHGGMSTVYLAIQESLGRDIALKVMAPALAADRSFSERFLKEGRTIAKLSHPHIVNVYDIGVADHQHYIAMEYLGAVNLKQRIQSGLSLEESLGIVKQIAAALGYAHQKGFIHRDVKPENVLFRDDGTVVLTDFGIAKALGSNTSFTGTGVSVGTPHYMSPEQARGTRIDGRSDLYSLGIVLYEMLTGKVPYDAGDSLAIGIKHINDPLPQLPSRFQHLRYLLNGLLAKHPKDRYTDVGELVHAIDNPPVDIDRPKAETVLIQPSVKPAGPGRPGGTKSAWKWGVGGAGNAWKWGVGGAALAVVLVGGVYVLQKPKAQLLIGGGGQVVTRSKDQAPAGRPSMVERSAESQEEARPAGSRPGGDKHPRRKFLSARTREYRYAAYMDAWRAKVERVSSLNYPERAKRDGLTGNLVLDVALNPDGSINTISIQRPSGFKVLDDAAVRIVKLAAPFAPFPEDIRKETDILHITRTWQFLHGSSQVVTRSKDQAPAGRPVVVGRTAKSPEEARPITRPAGSRLGGDMAVAKAAALKKKRESDQKRLAALNKKREEAKKKTEEERRRKKKATVRGVQAESERARKRRRASTALNRFAPIIEKHVSRYWAEPPGSSRGLRSTLRVRLTPSGVVLSVKVVSSSGNAVFDRSVKNAVYKASPLPLPNDPVVAELLQKEEIQFVFDPSKG